MKWVLRPSSKKIETSALMWKLAGLTVVWEVRNISAIIPDSYVSVSSTFFNWGNKRLQTYSRVCFAYHSSGFSKWVNTLECEDRVFDLGRKSWQQTQRCSFGIFSDNKPLVSLLRQVFFFHSVSFFPPFLSSLGLLSYLYLASHFVRVQHGHLFALVTPEETVSLPLYILLFSHLDRDRQIHNVSTETVLSMQCCIYNKQQISHPRGLHVFV